MFTPIDPRFKLSVSRNGTLWASSDEMLHNTTGLSITQPGRDRDSDLVMGPVEMSGSLPLTVLAAYYQKGQYTLRMQAWMRGDEILTDWEGSIWVEGRDEDYRGGHG